MKRILFLFAIVAVFASCGSDDNTGSGESPSGDTYDRSAMLTHWANHIIKPGYTDLNATTNQLNSTVTAFINTPNNANLTAAQAAWLDSYTQFQNVSMFEIGKAEELRLRNNLNTYPTDVASIENNILNPEISLELSSEIDSQGFPAIEYLLYGVGNNENDVIAFYTTHTNAEANKTYLNRVVTRLNDLVTQVNNDWQGGYATIFMSNSGSSATSSVNKLVNDYLYYYERSLRAGKVGIPAGVFSNAPLPQNVECLYEGNNSKAMLQEALNATQNFFNGVSSNTPNGGASLAKYLDHLNTQRNGLNLSTIINNQFDTAKSELNELQSNFENQVENDNTKMLSTYDELQKNVVYLKVDMMQALNIGIDYVDADGD